MPIARCSLRCGSSNAFRPQAALWNLFIEEQPPLNLSYTRHLSLRHRTLRDVQSVIKTSPDSESRPRNSPSIPPSEYINTESLRNSLQALRAKNRNKLRGQESTSTKDVDEVDILFEDRQSDLIRFSFPLLKNFERPPNESHNAPWPSTAQGIQSKGQDIVGAKTGSTAADLLEYTGMYVQPSMGKIERGQEYPWTKGIPSEVHGRERLDAEILGFLEYIKPTPAEVAATRAVTQDVRDTIKKFSPRDESEAFGSQTTGLALATSDIDIRLYEPTNKDRVKAPEFRSRKAMNAHLRRLRETLIGGSHEYIMARMRHARYPLISLMHRKSGLDIQIVASNNTSHSRKLIKQYLEEYPNLHAIYALIKSMLDIRGLTDVFRGGLGSYSLFMMIVAALKMNDITSPGQEAVWKQLVAVLNFYAGLDTYQRALTLQPPYSVAKHNLDSPFPATEESQLAEASHLEGLHKLAMIDPLQPYLLCLQDPADPFNDLGKKGYGYKHIQVTFKRLKSYINQEAALSTKEGWKGSILDRTVGPCFEAYKARRAMTEAYGQEILDAERAAKEAEEKATVQKIVEAEAADV